MYCFQIKKKKKKRKQQIKPQENKSKYLKAKWKPESLCRFHYTSVYLKATDTNMLSYT